MINEHDYKKIHLVSYFSSGKDARFPKSDVKHIHFPVQFEYPAIDGDDKDMYRFIGRMLNYLTYFGHHVTEPFDIDAYLKDFYPQYTNESAFREMLAYHKRSELCECMITKCDIGSISIETRNVFKSPGVKRYWEKDDMLLGADTYGINDYSTRELNKKREYRLDPCSHQEFMFGDPPMRMESYAFDKVNYKNERYILPGFIAYEASKLFVTEAGHLFLNLKPHPDIDPKNIEVVATCYMELTRVPESDCGYTYFKEWESVKHVDTTE